jgi:hypothetical protein
MRQIALITVFATLAAGSAFAQEAKEPCYGSFEPTKKAEAEAPPPPPEGAELHLTDNQCEAVAKREVRVPLIQVPQEDEDPMALSLGVKNLGGTLRFKIPFSF